MPGTSCRSTRSDGATPCSVWAGHPQGAPHDREGGQAVRVVTVGRRFPSRFRVPTLLARSGMHMRPHLIATILPLALACSWGMQPARADIYTWTDAKGTVNI